MTSATNTRLAPVTVSRAIQAGWSAFAAIPYWLIALTARLALAQVFWSSAQTHLAS